MEVWKKTSISEFYEVSNLGRFRSITRTTIVTSKRTRTYDKVSEGKTINPFNCNSTGYVQIKVKGKKYNAHRLVAMAFCDGYKTGLVVNHKNGIRNDNRAENLEWVTQSENNLHAFRCNGRIPTTLGKFSAEHPTSKAIVSTDKCTGVKTGYYCGMDAVRSGFDSSSISRCCHGEIAYHKGRFWRFAKEEDYITGSGINWVAAFSNDKKVAA